MLAGSWEFHLVLIGECVLDGLRWRRRLLPQECGIEAEKGDDEREAVVVIRGNFDQLHLKADRGFAVGDGSPCTFRGEASSPGRSRHLARTRVKTNESVDFIRSICNVKMGS
jgi:hypothetical protein